MKMSDALTLAVLSKAVVFSHTLNSEATPMPATALRPEIESPPAAPTPELQDLDWQTVAPLLNNFEGARDFEHAGPVRRRRSRRHQKFGISGAMVAGALVLCELFGLLWMKGLDTKEMRVSVALDKEIAATNEQIARTQKKISALNSSPLLEKWAADLKYRPTTLTDFDDVTKKTPLPAPASENNASGGSH